MESGKVASPTGLPSASARITRCLLWIQKISRRLICWKASFSLYYGFVQLRSGEQSTWRVPCFYCRSGAKTRWCIDGATIKSSRNWKSFFFFSSFRLICHSYIYWQCVFFLPYLYRQNSIHLRATTSIQREKNIWSCYIMYCPSKLTWIQWKWFTFSAFMKLHPGKLKRFP